MTSRWRFRTITAMGYTAASANVLVNPKVGLLFIDFEHPQRLRINGEATLYDSDPVLAEFEGAQSGKGTIARERSLAKTSRSKTRANDAEDRGQISAMASASPFIPGEME